LAVITRDRYVLIGLVLLVVFFSCVAAALAYVHGYNGVNHGLDENPYHATPMALTNPPGSQWSTAEVRHYFDDGSSNRQCYLATYGLASCEGDWGTAPCQKRYVGGTEGLMPRHWVRRGPSCPGDIHG
jgi:hypothetical protein